MKNWNKIKGFNGEILILKRAFNGNEMQIEKKENGWEATNRAFGLTEHPDYQEDYQEAFFGIKKTLKAQRKPLIT